MYIADPSQPAAAGSGWQVEPDQVRAFAAAVQDLRAQLQRVHDQVDNFGGGNLPLLGTSPVGQELRDKFTDRLSGDGGLQPQLATALRQLSDFADSAVKAAADYQGGDQAGAAGLHLTGT